MGSGLRLKELLRQKKLTIKQLAEMTGISLNTLYSITKRDSAHIDTAILSQITNVLNITTDEFYGIKPLPPMELLVDDDGNAEIVSSYGQEWAAFDEYLEKMGYSIDPDPNTPNLYDENSDTVYHHLYDMRSSKSYYVAYSDLRKLMDNVNSYLKFNVSEMIQTLTEIPKDKK